MHAPAPLAVAYLALSAIALSGCQGHADASAETPPAATVTQIPGSTPPLATDVPTARYEWVPGSDGTGIFSVGSHPAAGTAAAIPPGRYQVKLSPGAQDGSWMLCDTPLCGPAFQENATVVGRPVGPLSSAMYIGPKSRTLWLDNVILSPAND